MAVFRVEKNKGYTVMSNHHLRNKELSLKAKGLLSQMLSLPEDWDYTLAGLSLINREKIDAIREAVRELENAGYIQRSKIKGNLYELDYLQHFREVIEKSIPADNYTLIYEHGELTKPAGQYFDGDTDPQLGKFIRFEAQPNNPEALKSLLREQYQNQIPHTQGDFQLHIAALHDSRIETEARRIVENVKGLGEPDSPEKTHCAVELSPYFVPLATDKDMERLFSMLPYKSLSFSTLEGRHGVYALIDKSERNKEMKQSRPSVRAQLQTEKSPKVPKKTAKSKHHELEV